jgi:AmmeMemoRadiSam system protein A
MENLRAPLDETAQHELLAMARAALESYLATGRVPEEIPPDAALRQQCGAFVSLHRHEDLRGCIGILSDEEELFRVVRRCALSAALEDSRFRPVTVEELGELKIEISVLSLFQDVTDIQRIEVGRHGLMISRGRQRGVLLPQVAQKHGWDRETFLAQTCRKAGLPADAWRRPDVSIQAFEAQVFSESLPPAKV